MASAIPTVTGRFGGSILRTALFGAAIAFLIGAGIGGFMLGAGILSGEIALAGSAAAASLPAASLMTGAQMALGVLTNGLIGSMIGGLMGSMLGALSGVSSAWHGFNRVKRTGATPSSPAVEPARAPQPPAPAIEAHQEETKPSQFTQRIEAERAAKAASTPTLDEARARSASFANRVDAERANVSSPAAVPSL